LVLACFDLVVEMEEGLWLWSTNTTRIRRVPVWDTCRIRHRHL